MKITQIIHGFPPINAAGSELYTYYLSRELAKRHDVTVFHRISDPKKREYDTRRFKYRGLDIFTINNTYADCASFERTYRNDTISEIFGRFLDDIKPDIVHFGHVSNLSTTCVSEAADRGIPIAYTLHDYWLICQRGQLLKPDLSVCSRPDAARCAGCLAGQIRMAGRLKKIANPIRKRLAGFPGVARAESFLRRLHNRLAGRAVSSGGSGAEAFIRERNAHIQSICAKVDRFISPSQFLKDRYIGFGVPDERIVHLKNGFAAEMFHGIERKPSDRVRFGFIGSLIPSKGVHVLIDAFNRVSNENAELKIHGMAMPYDGFPNYPSDLKKTAVNDRIRFLGAFDNKEIGRILSEIDALVVPSVWFENSPSTIQEAFLAKIPVIASNAGGMAELVKHGVHGLLFEMGNSADLGEKLQFVADNPSCLDEFRRNLGHVKTIEENALEVERVYAGIRA